VAFRGTFDFNLDAKNRLTVPAKFRAALADGIVLARGQARCFEIWPQHEYQRIHAAALEGHNPLSPRTRELKRRLFGGAYDTDLDSAGRVGVPGKLLEHAGIARDVAIVGAGECLEVWDRAAWESEDGASPDRINELTAGFDHPS
jgi:MraZ protein